MVSYAKTVTVSLTEACERTALEVHRQRCLMATVSAALVLGMGTSQPTL